MVATLRIPLIRRGAEIEIGDQRLRLEPSGLIGTSVPVRDTVTGDERMRIGRESLHRVLEPADHLFMPAKRRLEPVFQREEP